MNKYVLRIPSSQKAEDWFLFVKKSLEYKHKVDHLEVDFNDVRFMETDDFVILACLIESFCIQKCNVSFIGGTDGFNHHLYNIKFKEYWNEGFDRDEFTISKNRTTLCLWKISKNMIYSYSNYAKEYFERLTTDNKNLVPLSSNIDEVFNNIFDHANSPVTGYIITQYYPKNNKISFAVCDFGVGIPNAIKTSNIQNTSITEDWKAILWSLEYGSSIKSTPKNRGFGLNNLLELTESSNGKLSIVSNNGVVIKVANKNFSAGPVNYDFKGTLIKAEVDLNTFDEKDESEEIFEF